jgi:hypothetical protein
VRAGIAIYEAVYPVVQAIGKATVVSYSAAELVKAAGSVANDPTATFKSVLDQGFRVLAQRGFPTPAPADTIPPPAAPGEQSVIAGPLGPAKVYYLDDAIIAAARSVRQSFAEGYPAPTYTRRGLRALSAASNAVAGIHVVAFYRSPEVN